MSRTQFPERAQDSSGRSRSRSRLRFRAAGALLCLVAIAATPPAAQDGQDVEGTRALLEKLVESRQVIAHEKQDWRLGRELLGSRIELLEAEIQSLRERRQAAQASITETDSKCTELETQLRERQGSSEILRKTIELLEARMRELVQRLPDPLQAQVRPLSQRIPAGTEGEEIKLSLSQRFESLVGILNMADKFNREVHTTSEVRQLADGRSAEVAALYVGLGQAYYASLDGRAAGIGLPSATGWVWTPAVHASQDITRAIDILTGKKPAEFVQLPVRID